MESARIANDGMGSFLCPPGHPEHTMHVETELHRRRENRGGMSLSYAAACEHLDPAVSKAAKQLLDDWAANRMPLESAEVQKWIRQVLGYFVTCYKGDGEDPWNVSNLKMDAERDPMQNVDEHAGINLIRKYYPEFQPTEQHFDEARWGA